MRAPASCPPHPYFVPGVVYTFNAKTLNGNSCNGTVTAPPCPSVCNNVFVNVLAADDGTCGYTVAGSPLSAVLSASPGFLNPRKWRTAGQKRALGSRLQGRGETVGVGSAMPWRDGGR